MRLLFRDAMIIEGTDREPFMGYVLVDDRRIADVGEGSPSIHGEHIDREIRCEGRSLLPGFINCHIHLSLDPTSQYPGKKLASQNSNAALIQAMTSARKMLNAGFTTVRDCGGREGEILALKDAVNSGLIDGPRIVACCQALLITGGHFVGCVVDGPIEVRRAARDMLRCGADFIKVMATGGLGRWSEQPYAQELFYDELSEAFQVARMAGRTSAAHAHGIEGIRDCIRAGVTSVEHGTFLDAETADMMVKKGVFLVPTFAVYSIMAKRGQAEGLDSYWVDASKDIFEKKVPRFQYAIKAGVKIAFGTDGGGPLTPHEEIVTEACEMMSAGASNLTVIKSLTSQAAELLQLDSLIGSIIPGKLADLTLVAGNPLKDITALAQVVTVVKEGRIIR